MTPSRKRKVQEENYHSSVFPVTKTLTTPFPIHIGKILLWALLDVTAQTFAVECEQDHVIQDDKEW
jgi:hypothetical protein